MADHPHPFIATVPARNAGPRAAPLPGLYAGLWRSV